MEEKKAPKTIRMEIPLVLFKRFKILCVRLDLSMPKQTAELIRQFVAIHDREDIK